MKQVITSRTYGNDGVAAQGSPMWSPIRSNGKFHSAFIDSSAQARSSPPWSVAGTFSNLSGSIYIPILRRTTNAMSWDALTMTVLKNDIPTSFVLSFPAGVAGSAGCVGVGSGTLSVVPGDRLTIERSSKPVPMMNGVGAHFLWSMTFTPTANDQSGYCAGSDGILLNSGTRQVVGPWNGDYIFHTANWDTGGTVGNNNGNPTQWSIIPCAGNVNRLDVNLTVAPGVGKSRTFTLQNTGTMLNGSGGTADTRVVISDLATSGSATFTAPMSVLNYLTLCHDSSGTPASSHAMYSTAFTPTTAGQYAMNFQQSNSGASTVATDWFGNFGAGNEQGTPFAPTPPGAPPADGETFMSLPGAVDPFTLTGFIVSIYASPGAGNSYIVTTRKNLASPANTPTVTLSDTTCVAQTNEGSVAFSSPFDLLDVQTDPSSGPNSVHWGWTWLVVSPEEPPPPPPEAGCPEEGEGCILTLPLC